MPISHSSDHNREHSHLHTVEVAAYVRYRDENAELVRFGDAEILIESCLEPYKECYLNDMENFQQDASMEHLGEVFFFLLDGKLNENDMFLEKFEISETPLRTYIITRTV
jgi:6-pyruvoyl tetrahydropterin synthase-like protein